MRKKAETYSTILQILSKDLPTLVPPYFWTTQGTDSSVEFRMSCSVCIAAVFHVCR